MLYADINLVTASRRQTHVHLECIIDQPLERRQCSNHADTHSQPVPQPTEANVLVDATHCSQRSFTSYYKSVSMLNVATSRRGKTHVCGQR